MGYSARYHAASLIAVFVALVAGIVIGAGLGGDLVNEAADDLERSLAHDLDEARAETEALEARLGLELGYEQEFEDDAYPAIVHGLLDGKRIAFVAIGELDPDLGKAVDATLAPTQAEAETGAVSRITAVDLSPDIPEITENLRGTRFEEEITSEDPNASLGRLLGRSLVSGRRPLELLLDDAFTTSSGGTRPADGVIVFRADTTLDAEDAAYENAIMEGLTSDAAVPVVGVELSTTSNSSIEYYKSRSITSSDSIDGLYGKVALVVALLGKDKGAFGIKSTADKLIPELPARPEEDKKGSGNG